MNSKLVRAVLFILLVVTAGYLRETFFVRIKWYEAVQSGIAYPPESFPLFSFLETLTLSQLFTAKIIGTIAASILFWLLAVLMIKWFFNKSQEYKLIHLIYLTLFLLGIFVYAIGKYIFHANGFYEFSRFLFGFIETPLGILILFPVLHIRNRN